MKQSTPVERAHLLAQLRQLWDKCPNLSLPMLVDEISYRLARHQYVSDETFLSALFKLNSRKGRIDWSVLEEKDGKG